MEASTAPILQSITIPALAEGETYAGLILNDDGAPRHHLILLEGEVNAVFNDARAMEAKDVKELPTRQEQALLFANCKKHFERDWYWSGEEHASGSVYAWYQGFRDGHQHYDSKNGKLRCRFVRRLVIQ